MVHFFLHLIRDVEVRWAKELDDNAHFLQFVSYGSVSQAYCEEPSKLLLLAISTNIHCELSF